MRRLNARSLLPLVLLLAAACSSAPVRHEMMPEDLVAGLQSAQPAEREAAARAAWQAGPLAIPSLSIPLTSSDPGQRKNALLALEVIAQHACAPGAPLEREEASRGLVALLDQPLSDEIRCEVVRLLGTVADDRAGVRALSARLSDPGTAQAALFALQRCTHVDAGPALVEALDRGDVALSRIEVIHALSARRERAAAGELHALAERGIPEEARAARQALARQGDRRVGPLLADAARAGEPGGAADLLLYAEVRLAAGEAEDALDAVEPLLGAARPHERAAALRITARAGGEEELPRLIAALTDPGQDVRAVARAELTASTARRTARDLETAYAEATSSERRAELLRVMVARRDPAVSGLLQAASVDTSPAVRLAALELAGELVDPGLEPAVRRGARSIDQDERAAGRRSLLAYAAAHRAAGEDDLALELYHELLDGADDDAVTGAALTGVAALARPSSLEVLHALAARKTRVDDVDRARVAVASALASSDRAAAVAELEAVCNGNASRGVRSAAAARLVALGEDVSRFAAVRGFLTDWYLCGPFPTSGRQAFGSQPFGASGPTLPAGEPAEAPSAAGLPPWRRHESEDLDGALELVPLFDQHDNVCAYALAEIRSDSELAAQLKIGSDDGVAVWLNGERVHANDVARGLTVDQDVVAVTLRQGSNVLLLQVSQGGGDWGLCVRLCDSDGAPIDLAR